MNKFLKGAIIGALALSMLALTFAGGIVVGNRSRTLPIPGVEDAPATPERAIDEVRGIIPREALVPSDEESMTAGVVKGLLESLDDPYALYFDEQHYGYFNEQNEGAFYGIGVTISERDGVPYVVSVIAETPAERAGLKPDDIISSIDGVERDKWDLDEVVKRIRGAEGTTVKLGIIREDPEKPLEFTITRAKIDVPNIEKELVDGDIGYVRLYSFNDPAAGDLREAFEELADDGAKGFVLDLRDNPGGLLSSSVDVLSLFVKDGVAVSVDARVDELNETYRVSGETVTDAPLVVLINENSASASEIVAGGLQDYKRATLVGVTSFGKGSVQQIEELSFGGALKLTIAHYLTPKGRVIDKKGVVPEVEVKMDAEKQADKKTDTQYQRALSELKQLL
ncbi:MAG: S41 family peptidase [Coriobacteriia bacterium]